MATNPILLVCALSQQFGLTVTGMRSSNLPSAAGAAAAVATLRLVLEASRCRALALARTLLTIAGRSSARALMAQLAVQRPALMAARIPVGT